MGQEYLKIFCEKAKLQPNFKVIEVGCGMGRMALPFTKYFDANGEYYSIDNIPHVIEFNKKNITSRYSNFHFILADVYNQMYNPNGKYKTSEYKFPFDNEFFDFVFLASVFTHLVLDDMKNYLSEIHRVLKKGGTCFITYFLLDEKTLKSYSFKNEMNFKYKFDGYYSTNNKVPEQAIAFEEKLVRELYTKFGFMIDEPIYYGKWHGNEDGLVSQDIVIARKF